jgi:hypothetical protein
VSVGVVLGIARHADWFAALRLLTGEGLGNYQRTLGWDDMASGGAL